ncbi:stage III sporulation protein AG [Flintibacter porci]|uniref:stage III sporulation protein AG n=1 Tax=Flintibacter porci TaxID=3342383 RepID=UPI003F894D9C
MKFQWPPGLSVWKKGLERYDYVLLVVAVGIVLLLWPQGGEKTESATQETVQEEFDLEAFEEKLAHTISQIQGAGEAQVVLSLQSSSRQVLAQDKEQGSQGDSSTTTVTVGRGSGSQDVVPLQTVAPQFRGALVVCPGGDDPQVRLAVMEAVSAVTGLGSNHISVCKSAA